jgi:hypothetical protein
MTKPIFKIGLQLIFQQDPSGTSKLIQVNGDECTELNPVPKRTMEQIKRILMDAEIQIPANYGSLTRGHGV